MKKLGAGYLPPSLPPLPSSMLSISDSPLVKVAAEAPRRGHQQSGAVLSRGWAELLHESQPASHTDRNTQAVITAQNICSPQRHSETHSRRDLRSHAQKCRMPPAPQKAWTVQPVFTCIQNVLSIPHVHPPVNNKTSTSWSPQRTPAFLVPLISYLWQRSL